MAKGIDAIQSEMISFLRFPMMVLVVCIHADMFGRSGCSATASAVMDVFSNVIARTAVPLFFLFSGFLFFKGGMFSREMYKDKLKRRVKSLLLPYLAWNLAVLVLVCFRSGKMPGLLEIFAAFYDYNGSSAPVSGQFWFIRDLILMNLLSPLVYWLCHGKFGWLFISLVFVLWLLCGDDAPHLIDVAAISFYSIGAYLGIRKINLADLTIKFGFWPYLYLLLVPADFFLKGTPVHGYIHNIGIFFGAFLMLRMALKIVSRDKFRPGIFFPSASFFIFALHDPWCFSVIRKLIAAFPDIPILSKYFLMIVLSVVIALAVYYTICIIMPRVADILVGGRAYRRTTS